MNLGTKIRATMTIFAIIVAFIWMTLYFSVFSVVACVIIICTEIINHWYNNDYTEEHALMSGKARQMRKEKTADYIGERFFDEGDE